MMKRQPFITEAYFNTMFPVLSTSRDFWLAQDLEEDSPGQGEALKWQNIAIDSFAAILLSYTAGLSIDALEGPLEGLIEAYEKHQQCLAQTEENPQVAPLNIKSMLAHYEEFIQVVSLCILLHRYDLLKRMAHLFDSAGFAGRDALYEALLAPTLGHRSNTDSCYHALYRPLASLTQDSIKSNEKPTKIADYCKVWYPAFASAQAYWYDSHKTMTDDDGSYFGYWALEAGAIAYLYNIDDSHVSHMIYPKELVEYARLKNKQPDNRAQPKIYAGEPCYRTGYWYSPAQNNSRRFFNQGEIMPEFKDSPWGATIWYWSGEKE